VSVNGAQRCCRRNYRRFPRTVKCKVNSEQGEASANSFVTLCTMYRDLSLLLLLLLFNDCEGELDFLVFTNHVYTACVPAIWYGHIIYITLLSMGKVHRNKVMTGGVERGEGRPARRRSWTIARARYR